MKQFSVLNGETEFNFNFPTSISEISADYLKNVTKNVHVAKSYVLVGIVYHDTLGRVIIGRKQNRKDVSIGVVPIFIKAGDEDYDFLKEATIKDKLIIPSSQLALGHHVACPSNVLSLDYFIKCIDKDTTIAARYSNNYGKEICYFIEFKLVQAFDIVGFYSNDTLDFENNYLKINNLDSE